MAKLDIQKQKKLSLARIFSLTLTAIRYRLFRSVVTMVVIAVAIAFMMNTLSEAISKTAVNEYAGEKLRESRIASRWAARLTMVPSKVDLLETAASLAPDDSLFAEMLRMGGLEERQLMMLRSKSGIALDYLRFFADLDYGQRKALIQDAEGVEAFSMLRDESQFDRFSGELELLSSVRLPGGISEFAEFLDSWPKVQGVMNAIQAGRRRAITAVDSALGGKPVMTALMQIDGDFGTIVRDCGFALPRDKARAIAEQAVILRETRMVNESFKHPDVISRIAARMNKMTKEVGDSTIWRMLQNENQAEWFAGLLGDTNLEARRLNGSRIATLAHSLLENKKLDRALKATQDTGGGFLGMGSRMSWLVILSMIVCGVGITNAMLMSVTERFREIATMKCLGSLDSFVMQMFILEAAMIGVIGGVIGGFLGMALGLGKMLAGFGAVFIESFSFGGLAIGMIVSLTGGIVLASLASLYPSWVAARLAPMEAMRIE